MKENKKWIVEYAHDDGRSGMIIVETEIGKSQSSQYGNGKYGALIFPDWEQVYDLRYNRDKDLHMVMLRDFFGKGLVKAGEVRKDEN